MTRLIPTRDRAQATRYEREELARAAMYSPALEPLPCTRHRLANGDWIIEVDEPAIGEFWSGPWYVREVAE